MMSTCVICLDNFECIPGVNRLDNCSCSICDLCLTNWFTINVRDGKMKICCPHPYCKKKVTESDLTRFLDKIDYDRHFYNKTAMRAVRKINRQLEIQKDEMFHHYFIQEGMLLNISAILSLGNQTRIIVLALVICALIFTFVLYNTVTVTVQRAK